MGLEHAGSPRRHIEVREDAGRCLVLGFFELRMGACMKNSLLQI